MDIYIYIYSDTHVSCVTVVNDDRWLIVDLFGTRRPKKNTVFFSEVNDREIRSSANLKHVRYGRSLP